MEEISVIGIDLAKNVFQLAGLSAAGRVVWTKRLKRAAFMKFMDDAPRCLVGMEACGGAHYWGRWFLARGFRVKLMAPKSVKAYRLGAHKNDDRDARACAEAASRHYVASVRVKSEGSQAMQALVRIRTRRLRQMVQTANQLRGLLNEFGIIVPKGRRRMLDAIARLRGEGSLPAEVVGFVESMCHELLEQDRSAKEATEELSARVKAEESCMRLMTVPNLGPINAASLSVALEIPSEFGNARAFAAYLRLVPRQSKSAERETMLGVGRQNANETRRHLVLAAQSLFNRLARMKELPNDRFLLWAHALLQRKKRNIAAVAVAARLARIAWAVAAKEQPYRPRLAT
jgi:transposase